MSNTTTRRGVLEAAMFSVLAVGSSRIVPESAAAAVPGLTNPWDVGELPSEARGSLRMATTAKAFLATLTVDQRKKAAFALKDAARTQWSNFPAGFSPRPGISIADLTDAQRIAMHELLRASTSSQGYHKMTGAIRADDILHDTDNPTMFGAANYYVSVFGSPESDAWAWMLTGHHMSAVFTISGERTAFTPMFTGAQPLQIATGLHAGWQVLPDDAARAAQLFASLTPKQRGVAVLSTEAPGDVFAGPGRQTSLATFQGIPASDLTPEQQRLLWLVVEEFVRNANFEAAEHQLALVKANWKQTHFAWQGPAPSPTERFYFRVHGPRILIEYDVQEELSKNGGHVHAITRDPKNDYGVDWLALHYTEPGGHGPGGAGGPGGPGGPPPGGRPPPFPMSSPTP